MKNFEHLLISSKASISQAISKLDEVTTHFKIEKPNLFVIDDNYKLLGSISDGDIRRAMLKKLSSDDLVEIAMFKKCRRIKSVNLNQAIIKQYKNDFIRLIPIIDDTDTVIDIIDISELNGFLGIEAIIMAGGRGERLKPLTDKVPKPLIEIANKPIIEYNIDRLKSFGISKIHISVKYLANKIIDYFGDGSNKNISIQYMHENEPLGTIGVVGLHNNFETDAVLLMNSDLLTNIDFGDFYQSFVNSGAKIAIATIPYNVTIPYAVLELKDDQVKSLSEKPTYTYYSSAGIYLIAKELFDLIPKGEFYNATDLIDLVIAKEHKVINYPIRGYWLDIGNHNDYQKAQQDINHIKF